MARFAVAATLFLLATSLSLAQNPPEQIGRTEFTVEYPVELGFINMANGNLHIEIPLITVPQRGAIRGYTVKLNYDSRVWVQINDSSHRYAPVSGGWRMVKSSDTGPVNNSTTYTVCNPQGNSFYRYDNFVWTAPDGSQKRFPSIYTVSDPQQICAVDIPTNSADDDENSGYRMVVVNYTSATVYAPNGSQVFPINKDTNGNYLTYQDTLGRLVVTETRVTDTLRYYDVTSDSGTARYTVTWADLPVCTNFPGTPQQQYCNNTVRLIMSIQRPDQKQYIFDYDNGTAPGNYGLLKSITLPTGGQIQCTYALRSAPVIPGSSVNMWIASRATADGTWYFNVGTAGSSYSATTTDPAGNGLVYSLHVLSGTWPLLDGVSWYKSSSTSGGTLLRTAAITYNNLDHRPAAEIVTLKDLTPNLSRKREFYYAFGRELSEVREWDFYTGSPSAIPTRKKVVQYLSTTLYLNANIKNKATNISTYDATGTLVAKTTFAYDETAPVATNSAPNHDYTNYSASNTVRGNPTTISHWWNPSNSWVTTTNVYDDLGNVRSTTDPGGTGGVRHTTTFDYTDSFVNASCIPAGAQTSAYVTQVTDALGHRTKTSYFPCAGSKQSVRGENDIVAGRSGTTFTYDIMNRFLTINNPDGGQTTYAYDTVSTGSVQKSVLITSSPSLSFVGTSVVDGLGRLQQTRFQDPDCHSATGLVYTDHSYGFNSTTHSRFMVVSNPYCQTNDPTYGNTTTRYDALGRVFEVDEPDESQVLTTFTGNLTTIADEAGKQRKTRADGFGRLTAVWEDPSGLNYETDYQYDPLDNLLRVDQKGSSPTDSTKWRTRTFTYDSLSRLTSANNPESGAINYTYDPDGNVLTQTAPKPNQTGSLTVTTTFGYDALHRVTQKSYNDGSTPTVKYGYDGIALTGCTPAPPALTDSNPKGYRTAMCDGSGATSWSHDSLGRVLKEKRQITGAGAKTVSYTYNLDGSLLTLTYPGTGKIITYTYNNAAHALTAKDVGGAINYVTAATYVPQGALSGLQNGASVFARLTYNSRLQPLQLFYTTGTVPPISDLQQTACPTTIGTILHRAYLFGAGTNDNGNVISITNCRDTNRTQNFQYDSLNRITQGYTTGTNWGEDFTIDAWGNLSNRSLHPGKTLYEPLNAAPASGKNQLPGFGYDAAGNMTSNGSATYTYDAENRLTGTAGWTYVYDGDGERVKKVNGSAGTLYWSGTGSGPIAESSLTGTNLEEYILFNGKRVARRDVSPSAVHYYFADHLGSASVVTNSTGSTSFDEDLDYYPYGGIVATSTDNVPQNYKFTGKERDTESTLDNFGARYYSSSMGRFMTPDWASRAEAVPYADFGNPQSLNLYSYVKNNPLTLTDPDGHCWAWAEKLCNFWNYGVWATNKQLQTMISDRRQWLQNNFVQGGGFANKDVPNLTDRRVWTLYNNAQLQILSGTANTTDQNGNPITSIAGSLPWGSWCRLSEGECRREGLRTDRQPPLHRACCGADDAARVNN